jgi:O-succinylbenzoate synthase
MIEQPLQDDDIVWHRHLQRELKTPICLDESIHTPDDAMKAIELESCKIINIKVARVGGLVKAKQVHDICKDAGIPVWVGSMLESGVGEAYNLHFATLDNCKFPADVAPSDRYFVEDIIDPLTQIGKDGTLEVPQVPGMGFGIDEDRLKKHTVEIVTVN